MAVRQCILQLASEGRIPAMYEASEWADVGGPARRTADPVAADLESKGRQPLGHHHCVDHAPNELAMLAACTTYLALGIYTVTILAGLVGLLMRVPKTIGELLSGASVLVGYPFIYLIYEWVYHYAIAPRPTRR